eukprot:Skav223833  [mRNA]  locus=scaffold1256:147995:148607:- [translate_table: standard]
MRTLKFRFGLLLITLLDDRCVQTPEEVDDRSVAAAVASAALSAATEVAVQRMARTMAGENEESWRAYGSSWS